MARAVEALKGFAPGKFLYYGGGLVNVMDHTEDTMGEHATPVSLNPGEETIQAGPLQIHFLVTGTESNGSVVVFELVVPAAVGLPAPAHSHDAYEETIYGLAGVCTWMVEGTTLEVRPGQALCIPRGAVHAFANHGAEDAKMLAVLSPDYFREIAAVLAAAAGGPPDRAKIVEIMRRHGLTPAPPPPSH